jgi:L-galactose dehydrogenase/L-glyceraldehyde 3-phosphate reductase
MKYRTLGRTGLQISELVFGGGKVGGILIFQDDETRRAAIRMALDGGINWFDTAPLYGDGKSEEALGWLLKEIDETPYLSTKVGLDPSRLDDIPGQIEESVHASLKRLGRDSVDLLQLHNPISNTGGRRAIQVDHVLGQGAAADGLERMRDQGLTRFIGITALGRAGDCRRVIDSGRFDTAQIYYNLLNPSAGRVLPEAWTGHDFTGVIAAARARDMGLLAIRILGIGHRRSQRHPYRRTARRRGLRGPGRGPRHKGPDRDSLRAGQPRPFRRHRRPGRAGSPGGSARRGRGGAVAARCPGQAGRGLRRRFWGGLTKTGERT